VACPKFVVRLISGAEPLLVIEPNPYSDPVCPDCAPLPPVVCARIRAKFGNAAEAINTATNIACLRIGSILLWQIRRFGAGFPRPAYAAHSLSVAGAIGTSH